jgi:protein involved in polysaccharide export with SLBB domain
MGFFCMIRFFLCLVCLSLASCSSPYLGKEVFGADEFVMDSYKIREGKFSILELEGVELQELDEDLLEEHPGMMGHVELAGVVSTPTVVVDGKTRLYEVLSKAKISADANLFKSYVARDGKMIPVDLNKLLKEGDMCQNIVMQGGDKIYIAENTAASLMVMGEVGREGVIPLPRGTMSLRQALAESGGISYTGDKSYIQVVRGNLCKPKIYTLNWEHVICLPNDSLLLMPGDIVYVVAKPITEWHRFISQVVPSFCY